MHAKIDKADCMFLISDEKFNQFQQLIKELEFFTLILPFDKESYQQSMIILDIWYLLSTKETDRITNPENTMIYPYRKYFLEIVKKGQIKRYIQLALYENEKLAFLCAIYIFKEFDTIISEKMALNEDVADQFIALKKYSENSLRPYFDPKYIEVENYPRQLALIQSAVATELQAIYQKFKLPFSWKFEQAIDEASKIYEAVFGLINDWGGRVP